MLPRNSASRAPPAPGNSRYPPAAFPNICNNNDQRPPRGDGLLGPGRERMPAYVWKPTRTTPILLNPPHPPLQHTLAMLNGRKRQADDYSSHPVKRMRFDSASYAPVGLHLVRPPLSPHRRLEQTAARTSTPSCSSSVQPSPSTPTQPCPRLTDKPESSSGLQAYTKDKLSTQIVELFEACQQQASDLTRKEVCRAQLQRDIQRYYTDARLYLTGSSMNGLGCRSSDADMCLVMGRNKRVEPINVLSTIQKMFRTLSYVNRPQLIRAKVPILRFTEKGSDLEFDLNINNTVGIRNTFLMKSYAYADLRIRPIILVIKKWARHNQINDASKGTLSSYTLVLMVLHYLQTLHEPVVPSLQKDFPECFNPFMSLDLVPEGIKYIPRYISKNQSSLGDLLLGFLKYYATVFRWDNEVISVREAKTLPRNRFNQWKHKYICVEEPFERNNVARAVHELSKFETIKFEFAESYRKLKQNKDLNSILPFRTVIDAESLRR